MRLTCFAVLTVLLIPVTGVGEEKARLFVGRDNKQLLEISAGIHRKTADFATLGRGEKSLGKVVVAGQGACWEVGRFCEVGEEGRAILSVRGGGLLDCRGWLRMATYESSVAELIVSGPRTKLATGARLEIGRAGSARLLVERGARIENRGWLRVATDPGSVGALTIRGPGTELSVASWCKLGCGGAARMELSDGGQLAVSGWTRLAEDAGGQVRVLLRGKGTTWHMHGRCSLAEEGQSDAEVEVTQGARIECHEPLVMGPHSSLEVSRNAEVLAHKQIGVRSGRLRVLDHAAVVARQINVGVHGKLTGDGLVRADVTCKGTISPGHAVGKLTVSGQLMAADTARLLVEVGETGNLDLLQVDGKASLAGTLKIRLLASPPASLDRPIVIAKAIKSRFTQVEMPEALREKGAYLVYSDTKVRLVY